MIQVMPWSINVLRGPAALDFRSPHYVPTAAEVTLSPRSPGGDLSIHIDRTIGSGANLGHPARFVARGRIQKCGSLGSALDRADHNMPPGVLAL
ncbi:hypothetical protein Acr_03g0019780 [Actinidia rufa]|uniref:Uncharacterized protein n=1 Tax=Actinidia rufa TaxID=165716 RepID=A0A7J0EFE7_9ERIC|nr:hypothetical protein Acr_03g0019780 [Actinidia rufa]